MVGSLLGGMVAGMHGHSRVSLRNAVSSLVWDPRKSIAQLPRFPPKAFFRTDNERQRLGNADSEVPWNLAYGMAFRMCACRSRISGCKCLGTRRRQSNAQRLMSHLLQRGTGYLLIQPIGRNIEYSLLLDHSSILPELVLRMRHMRLRDRAVNNSAPHKASIGRRYHHSPNHAHNRCRHNDE